MTLARRVLFHLAMSERFDNLVERLPGGRARALGHARRYVAGEALDEAIAVAHALRERGIAVSLDSFGELVRDPAAARAAADSYLPLIAASSTVPDAWLSVDLSHIGLDVSTAFCAEQLARIVAALPDGMRLQVGAEDAARCDAVLDVVEVAVAAGAPLTCTLQANLRRSHGDVARVAGWGIPVRLVKGAFVEPPQVAFPYGQEVDTSYLRLARTLAEHGAEVIVATHDPVLREALRPTRVEMLLGVLPEVADALVHDRVAVRVYAPYGPMWFRYFMRRIAEAQGA